MWPYVCFEFGSTVCYDSHFLVAMAVICVVVILVVGWIVIKNIKNQRKKDMKMLAENLNTEKKALDFVETVPQGAPNPWTIALEYVKEGLTSVWANPAMGLKFAYVAVKKASEDVISHCQAAIFHNGGAVAVMTNTSLDKFGFILEDQRMQGVFLGAVRGFADTSSFGVESNAQAVIREVMEESGIKVKTYIPLAEQVNVDNAFFIHPKGRGVGYYLVIVPDADLVLQDGHWVLKPEAADKKTKNVVFKNTADFSPLASYGSGIDGFLLTGWLLFQQWKSENIPLDPRNALDALAHALRLK